MRYPALPRNQGGDNRSIHPWAASAIRAVLVLAGMACAGCASGPFPVVIEPDKQSATYNLSFFWLRTNSDELEKNVVLYQEPSEDKEGKLPVPYPAPTEQGLNHRQQACCNYAMDYWKKLKTKAEFARYYDSSVEYAENKPLNWDKKRQEGAKIGPFVDFPIGAGEGESNQKFCFLTWIKPDANFDADYGCLLIEYDKRLYWVVVWPEIYDNGQALDVTGSGILLSLTKDGPNIKRLPPRNVVSTAR